MYRWVVSYPPWPDMHTRAYCYIRSPPPRREMLRTICCSSDNNENTCMAFLPLSLLGKYLQRLRERRPWRCAIPILETITAPFPPLPPSLRPPDIKVEAVQSSLEDPCHQRRPHRPAALSDREPLALLHGKRVQEIALQLHVVARHDHLAVAVLGALGEEETAGFVCVRKESAISNAIRLVLKENFQIESKVGKAKLTSCPQENLRSIVIVKPCMPSAFFLR